MFKLEDLIGQGLYGETIGSNQAIDFSGSPSVLLPNSTHTGVYPATLVVAASDSLHTGGNYADYTCTGTDDQTTINTAIAALPSGGGKIILLEGTYNLGGSINIAGNGITLEGQGKGTVVKLANTTNTELVILGDNVTTYANCTIKNIYFNGNGTNQTSNGVIIDNGNTKIFGINYLLVDGCYFLDSYDYAVADFAASPGIVTNSIFDNCRATTNLEVVDTNLISNCIFITTLLGTGVIQAFAEKSIVNCYFNIGSGYNGICMEGSTILGNYIDVVSPGASFTCINNTSAIAEGNSINGTGTPSATSVGIKGTQILGNYISNIGIGISLLGNNSFCIGNTVTNALTNAIVVSGLSNNTIQGNILQDNGVGTNNTYSGILLENGSTYNTISGNTITKVFATNALQYCIREDSSSDGPNIVTSNICLNAVTAQISTQNVNTVVANNITT